MKKIIQVSIRLGDARTLRKLLALFWRWGEVLSEFYLRAPDCRGQYEIRRAFFTILVDAEKTRHIKAGLWALSNWNRLSYSIIDPFNTRRSRSLPDPTHTRPRLRPIQAPEKPGRGAREPPARLPSSSLSQQGLI